METQSANSRMSSSWLLRPVFLSSTFKDMQAERGALRDHVFPELQERLRSRRVQLQPIDLRQGVETGNLKEESERELLTLKVCLEAIDSARPLMIVLLGDRYGWVPPARRIEAAASEKGFAIDAAGKSVTALEIEYGLLKKDPHFRTNCLFLFRDPLPYDRMLENTRADYSEEISTDPDAPQKRDALKALKAKIASDPDLKDRVRTYPLGWDTVTNKPTGLDEWGKWVTEQIWEILDRETKDAEKTAPRTWEEEERRALDEFVENRGSNFVGREDILAELTNFACSQPAEGADWGACVTAGPGVGKSALFAILHRKFGEDDSVLLLAHAAGITSSACDVDNMLLRWITELSGFLGVTNPLPEKYTQDELDQIFSRLLHQSSQKKRVVVLIDALNQFTPSPRAQHLTWLKRPWPLNARIIATSLPGEAADSLQQWAGVMELELSSLTRENAGDIIDAIYQRYFRQVNAQARDILLGKMNGSLPAHANPLWLCLAVEQLNLLDEYDFAQAQSFPGNPAEQMQALIAHVANEMPADVPGLYEWIMRRIEKTYGIDWVASIVALVAVSRQGWRESDFSVLLPRAAELLFPGKSVLEWDALRFAGVRRGLRGQLIQGGSHGRWRFMHQQMQQAVLNPQPKGVEVPLSAPILQQLLHSLICDHLLALPKDDPVHEQETMWHLIGAEDRKRAARYYGGQLTDGEKIHATKDLARFILEPAGVSKDETLEWVCSLLKQQDIDAFPMKTLLHRFVFDLDEVLAKGSNLTGRLFIARQVSHALEAMKERIETGKDGLYDLVDCHNNIGKILSNQGEYHGAEASFTHAKDIVEHMTEDDTGDIDQQLYIYLNCSHLGDVYKAHGKTVDALKIYRQGLAICENLADMQPDNSRFQWGIGSLCNRIGDLKFADNDMEEALGYYERFLAICRKWSTELPGDKGYLRGLIIGNDRIGGIYKRRNDLKTAQKYYRYCLECSEKLVSIEPENTQGICDVAASYERLGMIYKAGKEYAKTLEEYRKALTIRQRLVTLDPSNGDWLYDLSCSHSNIAGILDSTGSMQEALESYLQCMDIRKQLMKIDPENVRAIDGLYKVTSDIAYIYVTKDDFPDAIEWYDKTLVYAQTLLIEDPDNPKWLRYLWCSHAYLGILFGFLQHADAVAHLQRSAELMETLRSNENNLMPTDLRLHETAVDMLQKITGSPVSQPT